MPDLSQTLLEKITTHHIPELEFPPDLVAPFYPGGSILNIPNTICELLEVPPISEAPPLLPEIDEPVKGSAKKVLVILMDSLALQRLQAWMAADPALVWNKLLPNGMLAPLTSIVPSTTCSALTTYWTGEPTARHGITGYEMWLKEYGVVTNMIQHRPITFNGPADSMEQAGFNPDTYLDIPTMGTHLKAHGVNTHVFQPFHIFDSGLSRMYFKDTERHAVSSPADLWVGARQLWQQTKEERLYTWVYWDEVDGHSHFHGPGDERPQAAFSFFSLAFEKLFLEKLTPEELEDTVVILSADHGQLLTPNPAPQYLLANHRYLSDRLHMLPSGENRLVYLYVKPGETAAIYDYIFTTWPEQFLLVEADHAARKGLFGSGQLHPRLFDRIGDLIMVARQDAYLWWADKNNWLIGRHGGMHPEEMLVPFFAVKL
jgi:predicted AlkP superfamily pyrophosphatase or phosphodiesterase